MKMNVDKANGDICYNDEKHVYWVKDTDKKCISVTTLIHQYQPPFDEDFWSSYKALEKILGKNFTKYKSDLISTKKLESLDFYGVQDDEFIKIKEEILQDWDETRETSCARGTGIHAEHERGHYVSNTPELKKLGLTGKFECVKGYYDLLACERGVFPEYLIYRLSDDGILKLAGQIDLIIKDGNDIWVLDYKSNRKLDQKSYFNPKTKKYNSLIYPLNNLMDCNMVHYQLQLSTYAWMIQQLNPNFNIKMLMIIHYDHDGNENHYELEYIKDDVERMLKHYKKSLIIQEQKDKNKRIEF